MSKVVYCKACKKMVPTNFLYDNEFVEHWISDGALYWRCPGSFAKPIAVAEVLEPKPKPVAEEPE